MKNKYYIKVADAMLPPARMRKPAHKIPIITITVETFTNLTPAREVGK